MRNKPQQSVVLHPERAGAFCREKSGIHSFAPLFSPLKKVVLEIRGTPEAAGKKAVFVSDLHWQDRCDQRKLLDQAVAFIRREKADYIFFGGDGCGDAATLDQLPDVLQKFSSLAPAAIAVPGNWEEGKTWISEEKWRDIYRRGGFDYLINETFDGGIIHVAGLSCRFTGDDLPQLPAPAENSVNIVLAHRTGSFFAAQDFHHSGKYQLVLTGHTHGGQIRIPGAGAFLHTGYYGMDYGLYRHRANNCRLFVSAGISEGKYPIRFNCRREIVVVKFV